jgi:molybdopterin/thiamine biosynthesis adenylyltransferase
LNFLLDVLGTPDRVLAAQRNIEAAHLVVFGTGAVGGWLLRLLAAMGFRSFLIVDADTRDTADVSRHAYFDRRSNRTNATKAALVARALSQDREDMSIRVVSEPLTTQTKLDELIESNTTLVVNAADEPYIGYTSVLLSRYCLQRRLPLLVAGGFDAHLGSLGELIVPGLTPCADCYASHFETALAQWKPRSHPIRDRRKGFGGLCSLSVFAASSAALQILRLVSSENTQGSSGRGELVFEDYRLDSFVVERNPDCTYCGEA